MPTIAASTSAMHAIAIAAVFQVTLLRAVIPADDDLDVAALHSARRDIGILHGQPFGDLAGDVVVVSGPTRLRIVEGRRVAGRYDDESALAQVICHGRRCAGPARTIVNDDVL